MANIRRCDHDEVETSIAQDSTSRPSSETPCGGRSMLRALGNERRLMILCKLVEWGEANVGRAGGGGRPLAVRAVAAPRQDARGRHRRLPARCPDHLVSHRRSANRAAARHPAPTVLPPATQEQERSIDHDLTHHRPARGQAPHRRRRHPGGYPGRRRARARAHSRRPPSRALEARRRRTSRPIEGAP